MERLNVGSDGPYSALEAAIHVARYALVRNLCRGKRVLDIACGEGYGSFLLAQWGAESVLGADVSEQAITAARERFAHPRVAFQLGDAETLSGLPTSDGFDLIVSIETIEHLRNPEQFLDTIRAVASPGASVVITCPNDHWYYGKDESNPFHIRKYTFQEFKVMAEERLGTATSWRIGTAAGGFLTVPLPEGEQMPLVGYETALDQISAAGTSLVVPPEQGTAPSVETCAYFVGVWGPDADQITTASFPMSMDGFKRPLFGGSSELELRSWEHTLAERSAELDRQERDLSAWAYKLNGERGYLDGRADEIHTHEQSVVNRAYELEKRESELEGWARTLSGERGHLAERAAKLEGWATELANWEKAVGNYASEVLKREQELAIEAGSHGGQRA